MAEVNGKVNYEDPTHIPDSESYTADNVSPLATELATFIRTKMYGVDVRESLARWIEVTLEVQKFMQADETAFKTALTKWQTEINGRQGYVEQSQSDLLDQFQAVIANATKDSEVILARDSTRFGQYAVLDDRFEYIESLLAQYVPSGFTVTIKHNQNRKPDVIVHYYEYAIGTETNGFGTGPNGLGETAVQTIAAQVDYPDDDTEVIHLPTGFELNGAVTYRDGYWYLVDGYKTLRFDLGTVDDTKALAGNGENKTSTDGGTATPINPTDTGAVPTGLTATPVDDTSEKLEWR